ncbi:MULTISPECIES: toprim domain-containing protein [unclassified Pseudomonas]|uniref:toprim domain-containing protein n=1 Tax=unclassified Pseudomonas TaxID=196821 RepID=UPI000BE29E1C|nr:MULTISPECIES: toprim domain-containing protein [unclassified Pseudomonas]
MKLMIIESPGKLKKLRPMMKKLRPHEDWQVLASGGHIRDLPESGMNDSEITTGVRKDYKLIYKVLGRRLGNLRAIKDAVEKADEVYLATDPDRELHCSGHSLSPFSKPCVNTAHIPRRLHGSYVPAPGAQLCPQRLLPHR